MTVTRRRSLEGRSPRCSQSSARGGARKRYSISGSSAKNQNAHCFLLANGCPRENSHGGKDITINSATTNTRLSSRKDSGASLMQEFSKESEEIVINSSSGNTQSTSRRARQFSAMSDSENSSASPAMNTRSGRKRSEFPILANSPHQFDSHRSPLRSLPLNKARQIPGKRDNMNLLDSPARNTRSRHFISKDETSLLPSSKNKLVTQKGCIAVETSSADVSEGIKNMHIVSSPNARSNSDSFSSPLKNRTVTPIHPRSILNSSKKKRNNLIRTPQARRTVNFGTPEAAEFNKRSPSMSLTPLCPKQIREKYRIPETHSTP